MSNLFYRRGRPSAPLPPPPPYPSPSLALLTLPPFLATFIQTLALPSNYTLSTPTTRSLLKLALYSFAIAPNSPHRALLFGDSPPSPTLESVKDDFTLAKAVSNAAAATRGAGSSTTAETAEEGGEYTESRRGKVCGHVFKPGESVYRCRECSLDATCVLCVKCYKGSNHELLKHDVTMNIHAGMGAGCCDCGDVEAAKPGCEGVCRFHTFVAGQSSEPIVKQEVEDLKIAVREVMTVIVDWMIKVLEDSPEEMRAPRSIEEIQYTAPPPIVLHPVNRSFATSDIFSVDPTRPPRYPLAGTSNTPPPPVLVRQWSSFSNPIAASPLASNSPTALSSFTDAANAFDFRMNSSSTSTINTSPSLVSRGKARASSPPAPTRGPWSVILWNDEKHSFAQVIDQVSRATGVSRREASEVAQRVDIYGRDIIYISQDPSQILPVTNTIGAIDLAVTVRLSIDCFMEQVACEMILVLKDLCATKVGGEGGVLTEVLAEVLLERREGGGMSMFQRLAGLDARLWKEARKGLAEVYVMLLGVSQEVRKEMSVHFAQIYSNVAEAYLLTDREPENSIISFGVQVFTVPSVSAYLVSRHQFLSGLISILYSFFTEQADPTDKKRLVLPPNPALRRINPESAAFKQKRYFQVFSDLNHLISSPAVKLILCESPPLLDDIASFLDLFTSMNPNKRAVGTHVEYESDTWVTAFNVTIQLGKICRLYGEAYSLATPIQLARALSALLFRMIGPRANVHNVAFGGVIYPLIDFRVASQAVSFHHPLCWLFAEMVKNIEALDARALARIGVNSFSDIVAGGGRGLHFLAAMDHPLRVIVLVAQIRAGVWVRNGFGMRAQQLHYKEYSLRENTFDQDIFFLQTGLVVLDPSLVLIAIVDRFQIQKWLGGEEDTSIYEPGQAFSMAEELLYLLIVLLSDPTHVAGLSVAQCLRRELVHNLCLGPCPYSELMRRVSEKFSDDPALDAVLKEVALFKEPVGISDQGTYTLRTECFNEIDPYFPKFSRNQREEAEKYVRDHLKKVSPGVEAVIIPRPLNITSGPFVTLSSTFDSDVLHQIIYFAMKHGQARGELFSEVLVEEACHLAMLALVEQPASFANFASERILSNLEDEATLVHMMVKIEEDDRMKAVRHKIQWCLDQLAIIVGPAVNALRRAEDTVAPAKLVEEKRLAAKARQAAIMLQFAKAQQSFLESSENIDDEDDEDDMEDGGLKESIGSCIVCQAELDDARAWGSLAFIQTSNFLQTTCELTPDAITEILAIPSELDRDATASRLAARERSDRRTSSSSGVPQIGISGLHASACGHMMHLACFETYCKSLEQRHHLQPARCHPENLERHEFICPLCKSLGNVLLPSITREHIETPHGDPDTEVDLEQWAWDVLEHLYSVRSKDGTDSPGPLDNQQDTWRILPIQSPSSSRRNVEDRAGGERIMVARLFDVAYPLVLEGLDDEDPDSITLPKDLIAFTTSCVEVASRGQEQSMGNVTDSTARMLNSLLSILGHLSDDRVTQTCGIYQRLGGAFSDEKTIVGFEPLSVLIETAAVLPQDFCSVAAFAFYTTLFRSYLEIVPVLEDEKLAECKVDLDDVALEDYATLATIHTHFLDSVSPSTQLASKALPFGKLLYSYVLPFLRRAAIIHSVLSLDNPSKSSSSTTSELSRLLALLKIPHPRDVIKRHRDSPMGSSALSFHLKCLRDQIPGWPQFLPLDFPLELVTNHLPPSENPAIYELVGLPAQLDTLAAESLVRECARCHQVPTEPAMCLLCGQIVCNQSFCCMDAESEAQFGECNMHMWTCGGPVGIYYLIKKNSVLYLYTDRGTFSAPPYLDSHGEVDVVGGRRGRTQFPQSLHQGRYDEVRKVWLNHEIATFVARKLEAATDYGGWTAQ